MDMSELKNLIVDDDEGMRIIQINRPKAMNALNQQTLQELFDVLVNTAQQDELGVVILTGAGSKSFIAGADISQMASFDPLQAKVFAQLGHRVMAQLEALPQTVIAAVNGYALGGGTEMALACDFIYASDNALFGQPEVKLGLIPGFGGTQRLMRKIPAGMAREMVLVGNNIKAEQALQLGLVNRIIKQDEGTVLDAAKKTAKTLLKRSQHAIRSAKRLLIQGTNMPLEQANALEVEAFALLFATDHPKEGTTAFIEKRDAAFSHIGNKS